MVLDAAVLKTQHYKVGIKDRVEQFKEKSSAPPVHLGVVKEKGVFGSPSTMVTDLIVKIYYVKIVSSNSD